jgi:hypothetical protein
MWLQTIKSRDGKLIVHGNVVSWNSDDEFNFVPQGGSVINPWWCKLDYWQIVVCDVTVPINKINVA